MKEVTKFLKDIGIVNPILQNVVEIATVLIAIVIILAIIRFILSFAIKKGADASVKPLLYSLFSYAIYIVGLLMILHILGVNTAGIVTVIGAASLAIGLALKDTLVYKKPDFVINVSYSFDPVTLNDYMGVPVAP